MTHTDRDIKRAIGHARLELWDEEIEHAVLEYEASEREAKAHRAELLTRLSAQQEEEKKRSMQARLLRRYSVDIRGGRIAADAETLHIVEARLDDAEAKLTRIALEIADTKRLLDESCNARLAPWCLDISDTDLTR